MTVVGCATVGHVAVSLSLADKVAALTALLADCTTVTTVRVVTAALAAAKAQLAGQTG